MQGIHRRHEVHMDSTRKGQQNLGQQTSSEARASTILWLRPTFLRILYLQTGIMFLLYLLSVMWG
jgi:hypothetical protein